MSSPTSTGQVVGDENGANPRERRWRGPADARVDRARRQTRPGTSTPALRCPVVATGRVRGTPEEIRKSCREEILRRLESIQNGTAKFYTVEETLAHLDALCGPGGES